jgi:hypothetical protein
MNDNSVEVQWNIVIFIFPNLKPRIWSPWRLVGVGRPRLKGGREAGKGETNNLYRRLLPGGQWLGSLKLVNLGCEGVRLEAVSIPKMYLPSLLSWSRGPTLASLELVRLRGAGGRYMYLLPFIYWRRSPRPASLELVRLVGLTDWYHFSMTNLRLVSMELKRLEEG